MSMVHELRSVSKAFASLPTVTQYRTNSLFKNSKYAHVTDDFRMSITHAIIAEGYELVDGDDWRALLFKSLADFYGLQIPKHPNFCYSYWV